jgi:hypothetical protein
MSALAVAALACLAVTLLLLWIGVHIDSGVLLFAAAVMNAITFALGITLMITGITSLATVSA